MSQQIWSVDSLCESQSTDTVGFHHGHSHSFHTNSECGSDDHAYHSHDFRAEFLETDFMEMFSVEGVFPVVGIVAPDVVHELFDPPKTRRLLPVETFT
ncbi:hypothetical protein [Chrysiogenes arsenatis]|uniref:hypothetical protein n=1 Tax=Chrysiogenes arsenatis TaxID=309797 RepID=UPI00135F1AD6|nr:hypothetical protein [Chrysiogenes arsenatis]